MAGRSQISNKKIGPVPDGVSSAGLLTNPYIALLNTLGDKLDDDRILLSGLEMVPCIYHRSTQTFDSIQTHVAQDTSRVNRRRTVRVGI